MKEKYQNLQKFIINSICHFISQIIKNHWNNFNNPNALSQQDLVFEYFINVKLAESFTQKLTNDT